MMEEHMHPITLTGMKRRKLTKSFLRKLTSVQTYVRSKRIMERENSLESLSDLFLFQWNMTILLNVVFSSIFYRIGRLLMKVCF